MQSSRVELRGRFAFGFCFQCKKVRRLRRDGLKIPTTKEELRVDKILREKYKPRISYGPTFRPPTARTLEQYERVKACVERIGYYCANLNLARRFVNDNDGYIYADIPINGALKKVVIKIERFRASALPLIVNS